MNMFEKTVRILLVEDNDGDARLLELTLKKVPSLPHELVRTDRLAPACEMTAHEQFDILMLDLSLPDSHGLDTLDRMSTAAPSLPIVVFTANDDDVMGMEALQRGAQDYIVKGQTDARTLARSLRYAIERKRSQLALQAAHDQLEQRVKERTAELENAITVLGEEVSERRHIQDALNGREMQLQQMADAIPDVVYLSTPDMGRILFVNAAYERIWGRSRDSLYERPQSWVEAIVPEDRPKVENTIRQWRAEAVSELTSSNEFRIRRPDGSIAAVQGRTFAICDEHGKVLSVCGMVTLLQEQNVPAQAKKASAAR